MRDGDGFVTGRRRIWLEIGDISRCSRRIRRDRYRRYFITIVCFVHLQRFEQLQPRRPSTRARKVTGPRTIPAVAVPHPVSPPPCCDVAIAITASPPFAPGLPSDIVEDAAAGFVRFDLAGGFVDGGAGAEIVAVEETAAGGAEGVGGAADVAGP